MTTTSLGYSLERPDVDHLPGCEDGPAWYQCAKTTVTRVQPVTNAITTYVHQCAPFTAGESRNWCADCGRMASKIEGCVCEAMEWFS